MSGKNENKVSPGGESSDESHNPTMEPPLPSDTSVAEDSVEGGMQQDGNDFELFTLSKVLDNWFTPWESSEMTELIDYY